VAQLQELDREPKKSAYDQPTVREARYTADVIDLTRPERPVCGGTITYRGDGKKRPGYGPSPLARAVLQPVCGTGGKVLCEALARD
jgi:hypothetical protein